jgi:galactokinase
MQIVVSLHYRIPVQTIEIVAFVKPDARGQGARLRGGGGGGGGVAEKM